MSDRLIEPILSIVETLPTEISDEICAPLKAYNREQNAEFFAKRDLPEHTARGLNIVARNAAGQIIAGLLGETQFSWLKIEILAVVSEARGRGIGSLLMQRAEEEARSRGCIYAYVDTSSYQAPQFYEKLGYSEVGRLRNWDSHGHDKIMFTKRLG